MQQLYNFAVRHEFILKNIAVNIVFSLRKESWCMFHMFPTILQ